MTPAQAVVKWRLNMMNKKTVKDVIAGIWSHGRGTGQKAQSSMDKLQELLEEEDTSEQVDTLRIRKNPDDTRRIWTGEAREHILHLTDLKNPGQTFQVPLTDSVIIGRNANEADLVIDYDRSVSGKHCQICERDGKFYVRDLQSSNGSLLNGIRLSDEMEIYSGSILTLGRLEIKVQIK